ncbi:peptidoglycan DD-metalloendopeptidase family protein [Microbacterium sp. No. 7]|uniref:peptidoglycan DD-metalloendopeptidase family protein n=1 Tax=Microbacterium sp. No. 7 TaxID=1714373 RepID=UPI0006D28C5F|nr:peptidoglycan DD-metalloendopeptidase family protein [Microbacterium sp. No. 7]
MTATYPGAAFFVQSPNCAPRRAGARITHVILHLTGNLADHTAYFSRRNERSVAPHLYPRPDGMLTQFVRFGWRAWTTAVPLDESAVTFEIEAVGDATPEQYEAVARFIAWLADQTEVDGIPVDFEISRARVIGHREAPGVTSGTVCPVDLNIDRIVARARDLRGARMLWPNGTTTEPKRSDGYGPRTSILTSAGWTRPFHVGTDHHSIGTIRAIAAGTVIESGWIDWAGNQVLVYLGELDGIRTWVRYCHLAWPSLLSRGDQVAAGAVIGTEGATGQAAGVHLHWEIYRGRVDRGTGSNPGATTDPRAFILAHMNQTAGSPAGGEDDMSAEAERKIAAIYDAIFTGGTSMPDNQRSLAASVAETVQLGRITAGRTGVIQGFYRRSELGPEWMLIDPSFPPHPEHPEQDGYRVTTDAEIARLMGTNPVLISRKDYIARQAAARERAATWRAAVAPSFEA